MNELYMRFDEATSWAQNQNITGGDKPSTGLALVTDSSWFYVKTLLGQGGSARVLRCVDEINQHYALKVVKSEKKFSDEKIDKILLKEYNASKLLEDHPNILKWLSCEKDARLIYGDITESVKFNVSEVAENGSLSRFIRGTGHLEEHIARFLFWQLASAVGYMHDKLIAHFDIKLENILLDKYFNIKLADFGSSEVMRSHEAVFQYKKGTTYYMAPEVSDWISGHSSYLPFMADVYSLGICLYLMLFGEFPVTEKANEYITESSDHDMDTDKDCKLGLKIESQLTPEWIDILNLMLRKNPNERPSMRELLQHPFFSGLWFEMCTEVYQEFSARKNFLLSSQYFC